MAMIDRTTKLIDTDCVCHPYADPGSLVYLGHSLSWLRALVLP